MICAGGNSYCWHSAAKVLSSRNAANAILALNAALNTRRLRRSDDLLMMSFCCQESILPAQIHYHALIPIVRFYWATCHNDCSTKKFQFMKNLILTYALCGNIYTESIARIFFGDNLIIIHRSNAKKFSDKIKRIVIFLLVLLSRYTFCLLPNIGFNLAIPHSANKYNLILKILSPNNVYLIDDGITFEYWSKFHDKNVLNIITKDFKHIELIGPRIPNWPHVYGSLFINIVSRGEVVRKMLELYQNVTHKKSNKDDKCSSVCVLDDGQSSLAQLKRIANDFKSFYELDFCHILMHPSRPGLPNNTPAEVFIVETKGVKGIYGNASTTLFNLIQYDKNINVFTSKTSCEDLNESLKSAGVKFLTWSETDGFA